MQELVGGIAEAPDLALMLPAGDGRARDLEPFDVRADLLDRLAFPGRAADVLEPLELALVVVDQAVGAREAELVGPARFPLERRGRIVRQRTLAQGIQIVSV